MAAATVPGIERAPPVLQHIGSSLGVVGLNRNIICVMLKLILKGVVTGESDKEVKNALFTFILEVYIVIVTAIALNVPEEALNAIEELIKAFVRLFWG